MEDNPNNPKRRRHIAFWILFPIAFLVLLAITLLLFDLTNGPLVYFILALVALAALAVSSILLLNKKIGFRFIPWGAYFTIFFICFSFSTPIRGRLPAYYYDNPVYVDGPLETLNGKIQGVYNKEKNVEIYAGIPYAKAPLGELRWKEPVPVENWEGTLDCSHFAPRFIQDSSSALVNSAIDMYAEGGWHPNYLPEPVPSDSEDALYLNVWKPVNANSAPILVYIHGGSMVHGYSGDHYFNGESLAKEGVIMVTIAYRLGIFGFFAHPDLAKESPTGCSGNYGLLDQIEALRWVKRNAERFGGDPNAITIAGESAGSSCVSALCTSPLISDEHLFRYAIGESSSLAIEKIPHSFVPLEKAYETSENAMRNLAVNSISELRKISAEKLLEEHPSFTSITLDGYVLDKLPYKVYEDGENNEEALLNGFNVKESDAFVIPQFLLSPTNKDNFESRVKMYFGDSETAKEIVDYYKDKDPFKGLNEIMSVYWFMHPHFRWSNLALDSGIPVYRYQFTKENGYYGSYHSGELPYCYGNLDKLNRSFAYNEGDFSLSRKMVSYWANFVKTGNPNGAGLPLWEEYDGENHTLMELGEKVGMKVDPYLDLYEILKDK